MSDVTSLRDRKRARIRDALIEAATRLFLERGFDATSVDAIAAAADVSRRTFFRYFPTKESVVFPDREARLERFAELLRPATPAEPALARLRRAALALADDYVATSDRVRAQSRIIADSPALIAFEQGVDRQWEDAVAGALSESASSPTAERRARVLAGAVMGTMRAVVRDWLAAEATADLRALGVEALDWLERGFAAADEGPEQRATSLGGM